MTEVKFLKDFAVRLATQLEYTGMTRRELAEESGLNESTLCRYLKGELMPNVKSIVNLSNALRCDVDELIDTEHYIY